MPSAASRTSGGTWFSPASALRTMTSSAYSATTVSTVIAPMPRYGARNANKASDGTV